MITAKRNSTFGAQFYMVLKIIRLYLESLKCAGNSITILREMKYCKKPRKMGITCIQYKE